MLVFELAMSLILLALSLFMCFAAYTLPATLAPTFWVGAGAFPLILSVILVLLSVWWALDTVARLRARKKLHPDAEKKSWLDELLGDNKQKLHFVVISAAVLIYVFLLIPFFGDLSKEYGFVLASFLFLCVTIKYFNDISLVKTILISAISVVVIYLVFHYGLSVLMPT